MTREELLKIAKPILFNTEMVRAIQDGRKTVTRRVIKGIPKETHMCIDIDTEKPEAIFLCGSCGKGMAYDYEENIKIPYVEGDYLYVRETFAELKYINGNKRYVYKSTDKYPFGEKYIVKFKWKPSIHMPKEAARIFLRVTDVRIERLQNITSEQICREGINCEDPYVLNGAEKRYAYQQVWNGNIKKSDLDRYGWDANPWVTVNEFERELEDNVE